VIFTDLRLDSN